MSEKPYEFPVGLFVGLFGVLVGVLNLFRAFGPGPQTRSLILGIGCTVVAGVWLVRVFAARRTRAAAGED